jgi:ankyrin repeat protein
MLRGIRVSVVRGFIVAATLAIALPAYAQSAKNATRRGGSSDPPKAASAKTATAKGADVNRRDVDGSTPLQHAVYNGNVA